MKTANRDRRFVCPCLLAKVSSRARLVSLAKERAQLRARKVQHIKQQIEEGTYNVSPLDVIRGLARSDLSWILSLDDSRSRGGQ